MSEVIMTIPQRLKERREELHLTKTDVAKRSELHRANYSRIELGKVEPRPKTMRAICRALSLDPETLEPIAESAWDELQEIHKVYIYASDRLRNDIHFLRDHLYTLSAWEIKYADSLKRLPKR